MGDCEREMSREPMNSLCFLQLPPLHFGLLCSRLRQLVVVALAPDVNNWRLQITKVHQYFVVCALHSRTRMMDSTPTR